MFTPNLERLLSRICSPNMVAIGFQQALGELYLFMGEPDRAEPWFEKALATYVKSPQVNVIVTLPASVFSQIKVIGQVLHPQALPYRDGMTVLDAVLAVGGLNQLAAGNRAHLVRNENGKQQEIKVKLNYLVNDGDMKQNLPLRPGDVLVVPVARF